MRNYDNAILTALAGRHLISRDLVTITARDFNSPATVTGCFWNDLHAETLSVVEPATQTPVARTFNPAGGAMKVGVIQLTNNLTIRNVSVTLNQCTPLIDTLVRGYDLKRAPIEVHRGLFDPKTNALAAAASCMFDGFVDGCKILTGTVGAVPGTPGTPGSIELSCVSHTRALTRVGSGKRSIVDQQRRLGTDTFHEWCGVMAEVQIFWGRSSGIVSKTPTSGPNTGLPSRRWGTS